jgi:excisionase family DNA binding protein
MSSENSANREPIPRYAYSPEETAKATGLSRATVFRLIKNGQLASVKIGDRRVITPASIDALLREGA